jgi:ABC-2 type transport system permease protein
LDFVEAEDTVGPLTVAMAAEDANSGARLVVVGDSDFAANADFYSYANGDLLVNSIDWAAHQDALISLTPKQSTPRYVAPPTAQVVGLIFLLTVLVIPGAVIAAGVYVWLRRRRQT